VNGELRQNGNTAEMIFDVAEQIEHLTKAFALEPGDLILHGNACRRGRGVHAAEVREGR
jgi:2-keto-4-pentenoate hydratase/2-oxohepta-3-ene-1,7-dioic acid hydratase in catechol pathway